MILEWDSTFSLTAAIHINQTYLNNKGSLRHEECVVWYFSDWPLAQYICSQFHYSEPSKAQIWLRIGWYYLKNQLHVFQHFSWNICNTEYAESPFRGWIYKCKHFGLTKPLCNLVSTHKHKLQTSQLVGCCTFFQTSSTTMCCPV